MSEMHQRFTDCIRSYLLNKEVTHHQNTLLEVHLLLLVHHMWVLNFI